MIGPINLWMQRMSVGAELAEAEELLAMAERRVKRTARDMLESKDEAVRDYWSNQYTVAQDSLETAEQRFKAASDLYGYLWRVR